MWDNQILRLDTCDCVVGGAKNKGEGDNARTSRTIRATCREIQGIRPHMR